jgi:hypothetical protein
LESRPPPYYFGRYWRDQILRGAEARSKVSAKNYTEVRFEDLIQRPSEVLAYVVEFFELERDPAWLERASNLVQGAPSRRFETLGPTEADALLEACGPGSVALGGSR